MQTADSKLNFKNGSGKAETPVKVTGGQITGVLSDDGKSIIYKGIPYAAPPVGELRWRAPQPVVPWEGIKACDTFSKICPQQAFAYGDYQKDFYSDPYPEMSEDCLYLNVWKPTDSIDSQLPVMVYFHGGSNLGGWSYEIEFDGEGLNRKNVILVTVNYRTGIFGFLAHEELSAEADGCSGNYGLMDQIASLQWVKDNIAAFGGDPENVTVFGQSAGAEDITYLVCSEKAEGLITRALFQSGGFYDPDVNATVSLKDQEQMGAELTSDLGASIEELRKMDDMELYNAAAATGKFYTGLCVDGVVLKDTIADLMDQGKYMDIDYLIGYNANDDEGCETGTSILGEKQQELGRRPIYAYLFAHFIPGIYDPNSTCFGAFHTGECLYVFQTLDRSWRKPYFTDNDYELAERMAAYWANFARTGDPSQDGLEWEPFTAEDGMTMVFDETSECRAFHDKALMDLMIQTND